MECIFQWINSLRARAGQEKQNEGGRRRWKAKDLEMNDRNE
jgi:hypothetical protein